MRELQLLVMCNNIVCALTLVEPCVVVVVKEALPGWQQRGAAAGCSWGVLKYHITSRYCRGFTPLSHSGQRSPLSHNPCQHYNLI